MDDKVTRGIRAAIIRISKILPAKLVGDASDMRRSYRGVSLANDPTQLIERTIIRTTSYYLILVIALVVALVTCIQSLTVGTRLPELRRDDWGGKSQKLTADITANYGGEQVKKRASITIRPKQAQSADIESSIASIKDRLPRLILGSNQSLQAVTGDLNLLKRDKQTGARIAWSSDRSEVVSEAGAVNLLAAAPGDAVMLTATIRVGQAIDHLSVRVVMGNPGPGHAYDQDLARSIDSALSEINKGSDGDVVALPGKTARGVVYTWSKPVSSMLFAIPVILALFAVYVFRNRTAPIKKELKRLRADMRVEFPDFLAKLLLLLSAGLVISSAIARIADDYRRRKRAGEENALYEELLNMETRMKASGTSLTAEFSELAMRSGQREIMRFSTILSDNIDKGSELCEKLAQEEHTLRLLRKKNAEEKARVAETKLTFPMALELFAVILITAAPAVIQMNM